MSQPDPIDAATENADAFERHAVESHRPTSQESDAVWRKIEEAERRQSIPPRDASHA